MTVILDGVPIEPMWYVISPSFIMARNYATIDHDRTGPGHGRGMGPRPWTHISEPDQLRGRRATADQIHWAITPEHSFRRTGMVDEFEATIHFVTRS